MTDRLSTQLIAERERCDRLEAGYRAAGDKTMASHAGRAAQACRLAARALNELALATAEGGK